MSPSRSFLSLAPFRVRSFRFQWPADLCSSWAAEMEILILGWFVLVQTNSVLMLTIYGSLQFIGTLAAPMFGVLGDRLGGRAMLCSMRAGYAALAAVLMALALAGWLTAYHVIAISAVVGIIRPNDLVMRNQLIGDTMPVHLFTGALSLSRATQDSARVAGALAGAGLFAALGIGVAYAVVVVVYLGSVALTCGVSGTRPLHAPGGPAGHGPGVRVGDASHWRELTEGLLHVWNTPRLLAAMWLAFLVNLCAYPLSGGLMPYVAKNVYQADEKGLGYLVAGFSLGALVGSIGMVVTGGPQRPERAMVVYIVAWYVLLLGFAHTRTIVAGALLLVAAGLVQSVAMISMATTLLIGAHERFRGRVMGVRTLAVYGLPLGLMAAGALVARVGFRPSATLYCAAGLACTALIAFRWRSSLWQPMMPR